MTTLHIPDNLLARTQVIDGLRKLADYLDTHPDVPVCEFGWDLNNYPLDDTEAARRAEVDRVAAIFGVNVDDEILDGGHYTATKTFGRITYQVICVPDRRRAAHQALMSYAGVITPDDTPADDGSSEAA